MNGFIIRKKDWAENVYFIGRYKGELLTTTNPKEAWFTENRLAADEIVDFLNQNIYRWEVKEFSHND